MFGGAFGSFRYICEIFARAFPLLLTGLAVSFAFRCFVWNTGASILCRVIAVPWVSTMGLNLPPIFSNSLDDNSPFYDWRVMGCCSRIPQSLSRGARGY